MPAEGRENPLLKKGNSDAFFREKYLTKNIHLLKPGLLSGTSPFGKAYIPNYIHTIVRILQSCVFHAPVRLLTSLLEGHSLQMRFPVRLP